CSRLSDGRPGARLVRLEHAQDVAAQDLLDVGGREAAGAEAGGDRGQLADVFHADGRDRNAVEVAAQAGVLDAGDLRDVLDVIEQARQRDLGLDRARVDADLLPHLPGRA